MEVERLRVAVDEIQMRMLGAGDGHELVADLDTQAIRRRNRIEQVTGLAADFEDALSRLDNVVEQSLDAFIVITIALNPAVAVSGGLILELPAGFPVQP